MANYQNLKAAISAAIRTNGNQEITGQVLQDVLNSIVSVIGANYTFAGVATPATNPGTPDQNVMYLAMEGGTYTNFNGTVLPAGISLLMWNGSWSSETVMYGDGGVFDISVYKSSGGTLATFADLSAALDGGNNIPASARKGGMSVKFVQSSDNKYVQYRLILSEFTAAQFANVDNWLSENLDDAPTFRSKNLLTSDTINKALCANLGRIDFCKVVRVSDSAGYEYGYEASPTQFLTELFDISSFVSITWKYHYQSAGTYLVLYDENKNIISAWGSSGAQRTILVSDMKTGTKYVRATFDWASHSTLKDWALIGTDSNDVQTVLWDESHLESEILNSIDDLDSRVTALENPLNDDSEKLFYEGSVEQPTLNSRRLNHDGSISNYGGDTYKTSKLIAVNYGDIITFTGATDGTSAPLIGYSKKEYGTTYFVEDLIPATGLENDKLFTKSVKITNHNIKYVASCGYVKQGTYTFKVTCEAGHETIEDMIVMSSLHNYYQNAMSKAGGFVQKYLGGEDVNIVLLGDSITAVANQKQNTNLNQIPCFMEHQNWCYWVWKYLNKSQNIIYRRYDFQDFFRFTGTFVETSVNSLEPYNYVSSDENPSFEFDWNLSSYEKTNILLPRNGAQCYGGIKIEVLSNNVATDNLVEYYDGSSWVEANGLVLNLRLTSGTTLSGLNISRNLRHLFRRKASSGTISIRVSKNSTEGKLQMWGVEQWNGQGVFIINAAFGGAATYELQEGISEKITHHKPDLVLFELTLVNNFGDRKYESNSKELMYNDFYDFIWGDRPNHTNTLSLKALSNNWTDWQVILVVPHWRQEWVDGDDFKMTIAGTPVKYSALDCYNVVKGLIKSKNDLEYLDLGSNMKQEAIRRGWTLEQSYAGTTDETMESIKCFTQDTVHLNNLGSKIYGMYIAPIFDI